MSPRGVLVTFAALVLVGACGDAPEFDYVTQNLRIAASYDAPICLGTARAADGEAQRIKSILGVEDGRIIDVYVGIDGVRENCPPGSNGCADRVGGGSVWTDYDSLPHELVHALVVTPGSEVPFIEEGLAEALAGGAWIADVSEVDDLESITLAEWLVASRPDADTSAVGRYYALAGHFVKWLIDEYGIEALLAWRTMIPDGDDIAAIESSFEEVYGVSLGEVEAQWKSLAPTRIQVGQGACTGAPLPWVSGDSWQATLDLDCGDEHTLGPLGFGDAVAPGMIRRVLVDVVRPGEYRLSTDASRPVRASISSCGCWEGWSITGTSVDVPSGDTEQIVELNECRYLVSVISEGVAPASIQLELQPESLEPW